MSIPRIIKLIGVLCLLLPTPLFATQTLDDSYRLTQYLRKTWLAEDGLPSNSVNAITQGPNGYIWIGTFSGLVRFDGKQFKVFKSSNTPGLNSNSVWSLKFDKAGILWIGTNGGGLTSYDGKTFTPYRTRSGSTQQRVHAIEITNDGTVWIGTNNGIAKVVNNEIEPYSYNDLLPDPFTGKLAADPDGRLWVGTKKGLCWIDSSRPSFPPQIIKGFTREVHSLYVDGYNGHLYIGTRGRGIRIAKDGKLIKGNLHHTELKEDAIRALTKDPNGNLWIGTENKGVFRFSNNTQSSIDSSSGLDTNRISSLLHDKEGNLWIGTDKGGLTRLSNSKFRNYTSLEGLPGDIVYPIHEDPNGQIWVGTRSGLARFNGHTFENFTFENTKRSLPSNRIRSLASDNNGNLWIATYTSGVSRYKDGIFTNFETQEGLPDNKVRSIIVDSANNVWAGTQQGIARFIDNRFEPFLPDKCPPVPVLFLTEADGSIWIGTDGHGVYKLNGDTVNHFTVENGLSNNIVFHIRDDSNGKIWFSTQDGITIYDGISLKIINSSNGLPGEEVFFTLEDKEGKIWMGGNEGIFNAKLSDMSEVIDEVNNNFQVRIFDGNDGLKTRQVTAPAAPLAASDGLFWIPTNKGAAVFDPLRLEFNELPPKVMIEEIVTDSKSLSMKAHVYPPDTTRFDFHYTGLSYIAPDKIQFQVMLEGYDPNWIPTGNKRSFQYTNLPPGDYKFHVKASNNDGVWSPNPTSLNFRIQPYFYQRTLFKLMTFLSITLGFLAFYHQRTWWLRKRQEVLEQQVATRTYDLNTAKEHAERANRSKSEFLAMISHEIRTPMNGIIGMTNLLLRTRLNDHQKRCLSTIANSGQALLTIINDLLDFSKIESGKLELEQTPLNLFTVMEETFDLLEHRALEKKLEIKTVISPDTPIQLIGDPTRLRQILLNLGGNSVKFTNQGSVIIDACVLEADNDSALIRFSVKDTGIGIPEKEKERLFNAFEQADSSTTRKFGGTGLGLPITKTLIEKMGGNINLETTVGKGSTFSFVLRFPIRKESDVSKGPIPGIPDDPLSNHDFSLHLLLAEDTIVNQEVMELQLKQMGHTVDIVENGQLALDKLTETDYDAILLDNNMPVMDGMKTLKQIRNTNSSVKNHDIYVIAVTANAMTGDRERYMKAGMNDYISKPVDEPDLYRSIQKAIDHLIAKGASLKKNKGTLIPDADDSGGTIEHSKSGIIIPGEKELPTRLIGIFLSETEKNITMLEDGINNNDMKVVRKMAHKLQGIPAPFQAHNIVDLSHYISAVADEVEASHFLHVISQIKEEFELLKELLNKELERRSSSAES